MKFGTASIQTPFFMEKQPSEKSASTVNTPTSTKRRKEEICQFSIDRVNIISIYFFLLIMIVGKINKAIIYFDSKQNNSKMKSYYISLANRNKECLTDKINNIKFNNNKTFFCFNVCHAQLSCLLSVLKSSSVRYFFLSNVFKCPCFVLWSVEVPSLFICVDCRIVKLLKLNAKQR